MNTNEHPALYPLRFKEILRDYAFGNRWIARQFAKTGLPEDHRLGETWEVCDRPTESSEIINGALAGRTLCQAIDAYGPALLGEDIARRFGRQFPLLIKFLDATHQLGRQVHTNDALTKAWGLDDYSGKTEAWYMIQTRPGATVFCGNRPGVTPERLLAELIEGDSRSCMAEYPARPGDAFLLYAGTMHHSEGGLLFYEIMQNSDVYVGLGPFTGALSRQDREARARRAIQAVHLEEGFDCRTRPATIALGRNRRTFIVACAHFAVERLDLVEPLVLPASPRRFYVLTVIAGAATVTSATGEERLATGNTCLIPACLGPITVEPAGAASLLKGHVPDLLHDVVEPLKAAGVADDAIRALGGRTRLNPLNGLL